MDDGEGIGDEVSTARRIEELKAMTINLSRKLEIRYVSLCVLLVMRPNFELLVATHGTEASSALFKTNPTLFQYTIIDCYCYYYYLIINY